MFQVWKTIKLGTGLRSADNFCKAIKSARMRIDGWADDILGKKEFGWLAFEEEVELVAASVADLGFKDGASRWDVYTRAKGLGLDHCPPEVGPQLRLQYLDQPRGEWLYIAMDPITDSADRLRLFVVGTDDDAHWLSADRGYSNDILPGSDRFIFLRRKYSHPKTNTHIL